MVHIENWLIIMTKNEFRYKDLPFRNVFKICQKKEHPTLPLFTSLLISAIVNRPQYLLP